jgi:hypothetical protein
MGLYSRVITGACHEFAAYPKVDPWLVSCHDRCPVNALSLLYLLFRPLTSNTCQWRSGPRGATTNTSCPRADAGFKRRDAGWTWGHVTPRGIHAQGQKKFCPENTWDVDWRGHNAGLRTNEDLRGMMGTWSGMARTDADQWGLARVSCNLAIFTYLQLFLYLQAFHNFTCIVLLLLVRANKYKMCSELFKFNISQFDQ